MVSADVRQSQKQDMTSAGPSRFSTNMSTGVSISREAAPRGGIPVLTLANDSVNIRIVAMNGASSADVRAHTHSSLNSKPMCRAFMLNSSIRQSRGGASQTNIPLMVLS